MEHLIRQFIEQCSVSPLGTQSERERAEQQQKKKGLLSEQLLRQQNIWFSGTTGISKHNRRMGFIPAFLDTHSGISVISRFADGRPAPIHVLEGLPKQWIIALDDTGHVTAVRESVIAGFTRANRFYTREEAAMAS